MLRYASAGTELVYSAGHKPAAHLKGGGGGGGGHCSACIGNQQRKQWMMQRERFLPHAAYKLRELSVSRASAADESLYSVGYSACHVYVYIVTCSTLSPSVRPEQPRVFIAVALVFVGHFQPMIFGMTTAYHGFLLRTQANSTIDTRRMQGIGGRA